MYATFDLYPVPMTATTATTWVWPDADDGIAGTLAVPITPTPLLPGAIRLPLPEPRE